MRIGIISRFPPKNETHSTEGGVAGYTKTLTNCFPEHKNITLYAQKIKNKTDEYFEDGIQIYRVWNKGILYPFQLIKKILKKKHEIIHIQHEFFLYGGALSSILFLLLPVTLKLLRIPCIVTMHGIVPLSCIDDNFVRENKSSLHPFLVKLGFRFLTNWIHRLSTKIIVHEEKFRVSLKEEYKCSPLKCAVIPLGIEIKNDAIAKNIAKERLNLTGKKIILFFGYITGYKGIELLIEAFRLLSRSNSDYVLIIAGGDHPRMKQYPSYQEYVDNLKKSAKSISSSQVIFTGHVPENEINIYFSAADLAVFPYTVGMSSSASVAFAISYNKPFIVSDVLGNSTGLKESIFERTPESLAKAIKTTLDDESVQSKLTDACSKLRAEHSWERVGTLTYNLYKDILRKTA